MHPGERREFLKSAGAVLVGAVAAPAVARAAIPSSQPPEARPATGPGRRTLRKAVMYGMIGEGPSVKDKLTILRDSGFDGVEMDSPGSIPLDDIRSAAEATGMKVHGLVDSAHWRFHLNNPEPEVRAKGVEALRTALRDGARLGSISVLLVPAVVNAEMPYDRAYALSQEAIRSVLPLAAECKVTIAIENVWNGFLLSPLEAARYVDELASPWVGWHFDIGNVINFGWPEQWVRVLGSRIRKLHIKDFSRTKRDKEGLWKGFDVELGEGDAGWPAVMKALDEIGYSTASDGNWATAEVRGGDRERLRTIASQMDRILGLER